MLTLARRLRACLCLGSLVLSTGCASDERRSGVCAERSETGYHVADYDDRLLLRETSRDLQGVPGDDRDWGELRPRLDDHKREWIRLRTQACVEGNSAMARCLDDQARALSRRVHAWVAGDPSWGTSELDDAIPPPAGCLAATP